jgi:acyl-CoA reductase-like NAD-dependent aldehyde dehydrogenase
MRQAEARLGQVNSAMDSEMDGPHLSVLSGMLDGVRLAQMRWAETPVRERVQIIARLRRLIAADAEALAETVPASLPGALNRNVADTLGAEVLPVLEACRFLERRAADTLKTQHLGLGWRPLWLVGVHSSVERAPLGVVLVVAAANYPLFLAGVQVLQALVAGNAVLWKPAPGTQALALRLREILLAAGLDAELLTVLDSGVESVAKAITAGVDHVVLTGSAETGRAVLRLLAETLTPATMELSGCDAVYILPGADWKHTIRALVFGMRLNGSCTCMAPRRVFLVGVDEAEAARFEGLLATQLDWLDDVPVSERTERLVRELIEDARMQGACDMLNGVEESAGAGLMAPTLLVRATPAMLCMQTDVFAPMLSVMRAKDFEEALAADAACAYGLSASIFGPESEARRLALRLRVGTVLINDVIFPTVDPRVPFGGRGRSGFGVTRGAEGLLAMTTPKTLQVQRARLGWNYEPTTAAHVGLFAGLVGFLHGSGIGARWNALKRMVGAAKGLAKGRRTKG